MKFFLVSWAVIICLVRTNCLGQAAAFDVKKLAVEWEIIENNYQGKEQFLSALTIKNGTEGVWQATGWKIYFNYNHPIRSGSIKGPVTCNHVNGDLFQLVPRPDFKKMVPGAFQQITFVSEGRGQNITDAPTGFYLVWDKNPQQGIAMREVSVKPVTSNKSIEANKLATGLSEALYQQNSKINNIDPEKLPKIFPTPVNYRETGVSFSLTTDIPIITEMDFNPEAELLAKDLAGVFGKNTIFKNTGTEKAIRLLKKPGLGPEAYELRVTPQEISIAATAPAGMFYGIQSLKTLLPGNAWEGNSKTVSVPGVEVSDYPRFAHRAIMLDVARNFQSKVQVMKLLDLMALYKLNVLHFHLNDDEGWRVEIKPLPELTEVGGRRAHTLDSKRYLPPSYGSGPQVINPTGSGYYSRADFVEILKYARDRNIKVIPEIETPGHARAAIKAMDARYARLLAAGQKEAAEKYLLRDINDKSEYRSVQNWNDNVMNVALPSVYTFLSTVVDELQAMYQEAGAQLYTIHFGGDEVPAGVWTKSPEVQKLMQQDALIASADDLWYYFFRKVNELLKVRNLYLSGWEEVAMRKTDLDGQKHYIPNPDFVNENIHVDVWNNVLGGGYEDLPYRLANAGYKVVLSNVTNLYFDMAYNADFEEPGLYWGGFVDIDKPFYFIPFNYYKNTRENRFGNPLDKSIFIGKERLTGFGKKNIIGIQGLLWTETIRTSDRIEYMLLPKILGLAERSWAPEPEWATEKNVIKSEEDYNSAWSTFVNTISKRELVRLNNYNGGFNYRIPMVGAIIKEGKVFANLQLPGLEIHYTTDGSDPVWKSKLYMEPIPDKGIIKLRAFNSKGRSGRIVTITNK